MPIIRKRIPGFEIGLLNIEEIQYPMKQNSLTCLMSN